MSDIVYYIASSLDGFIAHQDGSFNGFEWDDQVVADFISDQSSFGTVLMGRKTYDVGVNQDVSSPYPAMRQIVISRTLTETPDPAIELISDGLVDNIKQLKADSDQPIWLCGGAEIATTLFKAKLIDKVVVKLNPVMLGAGIPVLRSIGEYISLELDETKTYSCGIVFLKYNVKKSATK